MTTKSLQTLLNVLRGQNCFLSKPSCIAISFHLCSSTTASMEKAPKSRNSLRVSRLTIPFGISTWILFYYSNHQASNWTLSLLPLIVLATCSECPRIRHYSKHSTCATSINHHRDTTRWQWLLHQFYRWRNWSIEGYNTCSNSHTQWLSWSLNPNSLTP